MRYTLISVGAALIVLPVWASDPGEPLDCSDMVFNDSGFSCVEFTDASEDCYGAAGEMPPCLGGEQHAFDNEGRLFEIRQESIGQCGSVDLLRTKLQWYENGAWHVLAYVDDRCVDPGPPLYVDGVRPFNVCPMTFPFCAAEALTFDDKGGAMLILLESYCSCQAPCTCPGYADPDMKKNRWVAEVRGFATTFEILQSYVPATEEIGFRVPYMPEGFEYADWFDTYYGTLATVGDWTRLQPLQCEYPASPPSTGDYLTVGDPLPTPLPGRGYYWVTAVSHQGQTRWGRQAVNGVLSGRDPSVLPGCAQ
jgi:hypothetical protein